MRDESCQKCGTGDMKGPTYNSNSWQGREWLEYHCNKCGYSNRTPTHDKENAKGIFKFSKA